MKEFRPHPLTLRFPDPTFEAAFQDDYAHRSLRLVRLALLLGVFQYVQFGLLDRWMVPDALWEIRAIRATFVVVGLGVFLFSFSPLFRAWMQPTLSAAAVTGALGVVWMVTLGEGTDEYYFYSAGIMLAFFYVHVLLRLQFVYASGVSWAVIAAYEGVALAMGMPLPVFVNNNFYLFSSNVAGMVASYALEHYARKVFWQSEVLEERQRLLEAEDARKTRELEEARDIQLSMLPQAIPDHPVVEMAVYMRAATEVGGDYYDWRVAEDGSLNFAIGDATGHGARASAMVTATKILLASLAEEEDLVRVLRKASGPLKRVGLSRLYMALALGRLRGRSLELVGAGMPPALVWRAATGAVEELPLKGMPLGTPFDFPYHIERVALDPGDTVVLLSDGLPELFSPDGDMLGYERMADLVAEVAGRTPNEIVAHLDTTAHAWARGRAPGDDMTFLVLKVKPGTDPVTSSATAALTEVGDDGALGSA